jgi:hypothetical protein
LIGVKIDFEGENGFVHCRLPEFCTSRIVAGARRTMVVNSTVVGGVGRGKRAAVSAAGAGVATTGGFFAFRSPKGTALQVTGENWHYGLCYSLGTHSPVPFRVRIYAKPGHLAQIYARLRKDAAFTDCMAEGEEFELTVPLRIL